MVALQHQATSKKLADSSMLLWSIMFVFWSSVALCVQCRWIEATTTSTTEKGKGKCEQYAIQHNISIIHSWSLGILRSLKKTQEVRRGIPNRTLYMCHLCTAVFLCTSTMAIKSYGFIWSHSFVQLVILLCSINPLVLNILQVH